MHVYILYMTWLRQPFGPDVHSVHATKAAATALGKRLTAHCQDDHGFVVERKKVRGSGA